MTVSVLFICCGEGQRQLAAGVMMMHASQPALVR
jgi:hypothetical protein